MPETGLIVTVPEAESCVGSLRARFHPVAKLGVPAHVTLLFPFMSPERVNEAVLQRIRTAMSASAAFSFSLSQVGRFPLTTYLAPEPAAPFIALTQAFAREFPDFPPFGGEFETVIPHLTVSHGSAIYAEVAHAELSSALAGHGPIYSVCTSVVLLENSSGRWRQMHAFPLAHSRKDG